MNKKIGRNDTLPCRVGKFKYFCIDKLNNLDDEEFSNPESFLGN